MTNRGKINWSIWIGVWTGIYVLLYLLSPLGKYGIVWCTFIALPIFFNGGAARKDYIPQMISSIIGVAWLCHDSSDEWIASYWSIHGKCKCIVLRNADDHLLFYDDIQRQKLY